MKDYVAFFGGSELSIPALKHVKELGNRILVVDGNPNSPAKFVADIFVPKDFSDVHSTVSSLSEFDISASIPLNDFAIPAATQFAQNRKLPGWNSHAYSCLMSKVELKKCWRERGIPTSPFTYGNIAELPMRDDFDELTWPVIVKPSFSGGGSRGVFLANSIEEIKTGVRELREYYLDGQYLVENFVLGVEHTIEVLIRDGQSHILSISDKANYQDSVSVVQKLLFPGPIGNSYRKELDTLIQRACDALEFTNGAAHFEVVTNSGNITFLEVGGRPGGGLNFHPICYLSASYDYPLLLSQILSGKTVEISPSNTASSCLAWYYFQNGTGILHKIENLSALTDNPQILDFRIYEKIGFERKNISNDLERPGFFLIKGSSISEVTTAAEDILDKVKFVSTDENRR